MGLDIHAYSNLRHLGWHDGPRYKDVWCEDEDHIQAYAYDQFEQSFRGMPTYGKKVGDIVLGGCYEQTDDTEDLSFHAGSYGGYNRWRSHLQKLYNDDPSRDEGCHPDRPFYELIWFADNEGSIGPEAAKDLLGDFRSYANDYANKTPPFEFPDWWIENYRNWTRAFELAADGGLVGFH